MRYLLVLFVFLVSVAPAEALLLCARVDSGTGELRDGSSIKLRRECRSGESSLGTTEALARLTSEGESEEAGSSQRSSAAAVASRSSSTGCGLLITRDDVISTHCNVKVQNGLNSTATKNNKGNLIIGYDEPLSVGTTLRTGSHNLVLGIYNDYTSYGGIVSGEANKIENVFSVAVGGARNVAAGQFSSVFGGTANEVQSASVGGSAHGCYENIVSGKDATVHGGYANSASAVQSSIFGGKNGTCLTVNGICAGTTGP